MSNETRIIGCTSDTPSPTPTHYQVKVNSSGSLQVVQEGTVTTSVSGTVNVSDSVVAATLIHKAQDFTSSLSPTAIWTPASGKKFVITDIEISFSANGNCTIYESSTNNTNTRIYRGWFLENGGASIHFRKPRIADTADNPVYCSATGSGTIYIQGYEV